MLSKSQYQSSHTVWSYVYNIPEMRKLTESRIVLAGTYGAGMDGKEMDVAIKRQNEG